MQFEDELADIARASSDFGLQFGDDIRELLKADLSTGIFPFSVLVLGQSPFTAEFVAHYKRPARSFEPLFQVYLVGADGFLATGEVTDHERLMCGKFLSLVGDGVVSHVCLLRSKFLSLVGVGVVSHVLLVLLALSSM